MKLIMTDDEGTLLAQWDIEEEFGDLAKPLPRTEMLTELIAEWNYHKRNIDNQAGKGTVLPAEGEEPR